MRNRHDVRGGLIFTGIGIGAMSLIASAGIGTPGTSAAPAAGRVVVPVAVEDVGVQAAPISAPAAAPAAAVAFPADEAEAVPTPEPDRPVVQAGPGPATPVEGATTLIDPLVIER
jgi:hypothetical protein